MVEAADTAMEPAYAALPFMCAPLLAPRRLVVCSPCDGTERSVAAHSTCCHASVYHKLQKPAAVFCLQSLCSVRCSVQSSESMVRVVCFVNSVVLLTHLNSFMHCIQGITGLQARI